MTISTINTKSLATSAQIGSLTTATGSAPSYSARAWVNFNGTGTVAIRASGNVSSITDNGVGYYTVNFTTAMPDVNYAVSSTSSAAQYCFNTSTTNSDNSGAGYTPESVKAVISRYAGGSVDPVVGCISIFR